jgi:Cu(I)/Ag(I) efflux system membrane fusion protein
MNRKLIAGLVIAFVLATTAAIIVWRNNAEATKTAQAADQAKEVYTCPMHPTVVSDKPGSCPICGMALVKRSTGGSAAAELAQSGSVDSSLTQVALSPEQRVTANVRTTRVTLDTHTGEIVTTGRVTFDERRAAQVTSYTAGRLERLYVNFTGDSVRKGSAVAAIYSPDLYGTQQEYLLALQNRARMQSSGFAGARTAADDLVDSARRRLLLFGMTAAQIRELERGSKPLYTTTIVSPVSGIVTRKLAVEQQYVVAGQPLFEVADLSSVWVEADVYEQQLPNVQIGQKVTITSAAIPGAEFTGTVSFIQPVLTGATRTARVRIELPNKGMQLKPDMYVNVRMFGPAAAPHVMVPPSAVVDRGQKQFVWVEVQPGHFEPREVRTGGRHGEMIVILSGLNEGDSIVVEGGFLLDSEAQLRGVAAGGGHETH